MKIGFDLDGLLADFNCAFANTIRKVTGRDLFPLVLDLPCWDWPQHYGYTPKEVSAVWEHVKKDPNFWESLTYYPNTPMDRIETLNQKWEHDIYFITSRVGINCKGQTERWLEPFITNPTVLISSKKGLCAQALRLDAYIDDKIENCIDTAPSCWTFILDRPWNQPGAPEWQRLSPAMMQDITRVVSVGEMLDRLGV
jgi:hypothetical protein